MPFHLAGKTVELDLEYPRIEPARVLTDDVAHAQFPITSSGFADEYGQRSVCTRVKRLLEIVLIATFAIVNQRSLARWANQFDLQIADEGVRDADARPNPSREPRLIECKLARDTRRIVVRNREARCDLDGNNLAHNFRPDTEINHLSRRTDLR